MRTSLKTILSAVTVVLVSMVWMSAFGAGNSGRDTIDRLSQRNDRLLSVYAADGAWNNPDGCDDAARAVLEPNTATEEGYREKYAAILAAHLNGSAVTFWLSGCFELNNTTYPNILHVTVY